MTTRKCEQKRCGYLQMGGCRKCDECNAEPLVVDDNCCRCWNCEHDEGLLRWEDNLLSPKDNKQSEKDKTLSPEKLKPIVMEMKK